MPEAPTTDGSFREERANREPWRSPITRDPHRTMSTSDIDPPEDVPKSIVRGLETSSDRQLREIIHFAQRLLRGPSSLTDTIEAREGEEIVRIDDHGGYKHVVVERTEASGESRGPFAYRVQWEPEIDGDGGQYRWHYLGRVNPDGGGK